MRHYLFFFVIIVFSFSAHAQVQEQLSPLERKQLTKVTEPLTMYKGFLRIRISDFYFAQDNGFDENGNKEYYPSISGSGTAIFAGLQYGITDRLEVEASIPYQRSSVESTYSVSIPSNGQYYDEKAKITGNGFSDLSLVFRYQILRKPISNISASFGINIKAPTGKSEVSNYKDLNNFNGPTGKGEWALGPEVRIRKVTYPFSFELGASYLKYSGGMKTLQPTASKDKVISGDELLVRPLVNFHLNKWVLLTNYLDYYMALKDNFEGEDAYAVHTHENQWTVRYYPGLIFQLKRLRLEQAVLIPLAGKLISADPQFFFAAEYVF